MSCSRGNENRTRAQKHKNRTVFKNDLHDKTPMQKKLNSLHICEVCQHCKGVIEWKIKYKKYKPLSKPKTCVKCLQRNIKKAYHVLCRDCAIKNKVCAKCLKSSEEVEIEPAGPTDEEQIKLKVEMDRLIKSLPERKRRSFLRYMEKGKKIEDNNDEIVDEEVEGETEEDKVKIIKRIPHSREDLLKKIDQLTITEEDEEDLDEDDSDYDDNEEYSEDEK